MEGRFPANNGNCTLLGPDDCKRPLTEVESGYVEGWEIVFPSTSPLCISI